MRKNHDPVNEEVMKSLARPVGWIRAVPPGNNFSPSVLQNSYTASHNPFL